MDKREKIDEVTAQAKQGTQPLQAQRPPDLPSEPPRDPWLDAIDRIVRAEDSDPFSILGPHWIDRDRKRVLAIRAFRPGATEATILWRRSTPTPIPASTPTPAPASAPARSTSAAIVAGAAATSVRATQLHAAGFFEAIVPQNVTNLHGEEPISPSAYRIQSRFSDGNTLETLDPYAFPTVLTEYDLYLFGEGTHYQNYEKLGAHIRELEGVRGVHFAVWAPNAQRVSIVGDFNLWDGRANAMRSRGSSGIWDFFMPELREGALYKFEILSRVNHHLGLKSDPYGFAAEMRPKTASVVCNLDRHQWNDSYWLQSRATRDWLHAPMSIYEVHAGSWRRKTSDRDRWLTYRELADELIPYVKNLGYTHIEFLPLMEHPFDASWGYQTVGYFAVTSRYGSPEDFMYFVDRAHQEGIGVLLDWTPAHFPRDAHGLAFFDGTHLYEHDDPRKGEHPDWGTLVFNYGRNEVQNFLLSNALFWIDKYHIDGLRVDAVASMLYLDYSRPAGQWIPNRFGGRENLEAIDFIKRTNEILHQRHPGALMIAEESTSWPAVSRPTYIGGLGFDLKWNMGWMNDTLRYFALDPIHRQYHHNELTFSMIYAFHENFVLPLSHDEVVHGKRALIEKMPGDDWQKFANLRLLFAYMYAHPGKKLLFMGSELAQRHEFWEAGSVEWSLENSPPHRGVQRLITDLNRLHTHERALYEVDFEWGGFDWIDANDAPASVLTFLRRARNAEDSILVVCNLTPVTREVYRVGVPGPGFYREILNTDSAFYKGTDVGNAGGVRAEPIPWNDRQYSIKLRLPPLAAMYFKHHRD